MAFYEIDPEIVSMAEDPRLFTYLRDSRATVSTVVGDGRLRLEEAPDAAYDLIVLDAFSSDAVPVHLLTQEAFDLYASKLSPGGAIMVHVSNRYLDLEPVVAASADHLGWTTSVRQATGAVPPAVRLQLGHGHRERQQHGSAAESARLAAGWPDSAQLDRRLLVGAGGPPPVLSKPRSHSAHEPHLPIREGTGPRESTLAAHDGGD